MSSSSVRDQVRAFIAENFGYRGAFESMADDESLVDANIIDSVAVLVVIQFLEETYAIKVDDDDVNPDNLGSVAALVAFIERKQAA